MNRTAFRISTLSIILGLSGLSAGTFAQSSPSASVVPCQPNDVPGRPTLKRRLPAADDSTLKEESIAPKSDERENCEPGAETEIVTAGVKEESKLAIKFEGLVDVDEADLRKELRERRVQLPKNPTLEPELVEKASNAVKECLVARGYRHAVVNMRMDQPNTDSKVLVFVVVEGTRPSIAEFRFEGNRVFPSRQLAGEVKQCMVEYERAYYDPVVFDYCTCRLDNFVRSHGYLQGRFHDPKVHETAGSLIVTLQADEGVLYRLGEVMIEGASAFTSEQIRAMIGLQSGDIANGEQLSKALFEQLKEAYGEKGYIQYTADITPTFRPEPDKSSGTVDFDITIDEGGRFKIRKITFKGDNLPEEQLRQLLLIHGGDIFNQTLFERSMDRLDGTGLFEPVDKDRDADFKTNEEEGLIDVTIKLTKRQN